MSAKSASGTRALAGRGRPRKETDGIDALTEVKRERNRQAQRLFRARQQADYDSRIDRLERTILNVANVVVKQAEDVAALSFTCQDQAVAQQFRATVHNNLAAFRECIAEEISSLRDEPSASQKTSPGMPEVPISTTDSTAATPPWLGEVASTAFPQLSNTDGDLPSGNLTTSIDQLTVEQLIQSVAPDQSNGINANLFGNGWMDQRPAIVTTWAPDTNPVPHQPFSFEIIHFSLQQAYYALTEPSMLSNGLASRIFKYMLTLHSRQELLFNLRWFLGPGSSHITKLAEVWFDKFIHEWPQGVPTLNQTHNFEATTDTDAGHPIDMGRLLNAHEISSLLVSRGVRRFDSDVFEMTIAGPYPAVNEPRRVPQSAFLNTNLFFPSAPSQQLPESYHSLVPDQTAAKVSRLLLLQNLSEISLCLSRGLGFPADHVESAILASVVH